MRKIFLGLSYCLLYTLNAQAYDPDQLEQFNKTGICPGCDLSRTHIDFYNSNHVNLENAILTEATLDYSKFPNGSFNGAHLLSASLIGGNFSGSSFRQSNLTDANLYNSNFSRSDFTGANLNEANFSHTVLIAAKITQEQLATIKSLSCAIMPDGTRHAPDKDNHC
jgi:uncharacterized protein YjbI with pentapeptide repeats